MATTTDGGGGVSPAMCSSAADYARQRLREREKPATPAGLAEEYDCTQAHMRHKLADLVDEGEVQRVARGKYVGPDADVAVEDGDQHEQQEDSEDAQEDAGADTTDADMEDPDLSPEDYAGTPSVWSDGGPADGAVGGRSDGADDSATGAASGIPVGWVAVVAGAALVGWLLLSGSSDGAVEETVDDVQEAAGVDNDDQDGVPLVEEAGLVEG